MSKLVNKYISKWTNKKMSIESMCEWVKIYKTKVMEHPWFSFGPKIWIWKDLCPMYFWSCGQSFLDKVYKTNVVVLLPNSQLGRISTSIHLTLIQGGGVKGPKWCCGCSAASTVWLGKKVIKQKLKSTYILLGADHIFRPVIQLRKDLGHMYFWSRGQSISLMLNYFNIMTRAMASTPAS